jgi:hypothetical protein
MEGSSADGTGGSVPRGLAAQLCSATACSTSTARTATAQSAHASVDAGVHAAESETKAVARLSVREIAGCFDRAEAASSGCESIQKVHDIPAAHLIRSFIR